MDALGRRRRGFAPMEVTHRGWSVAVSAWLFSLMTSRNQTPTGKTTPGRRVARVAFEVLLWGLSLMLILVFTRAGLAKFDDSSGWARAFAVWGYPIWFRMLIGAVEIAAAVLLLWPRTAAYGAILIIVVMLGGMGTHVVIEHRPGRVTSELGQLTFSSIVLAGRWRRRFPISRR
jgi:hypothetical protein